MPRDTAHGLVREVIMGSFLFYAAAVVQVLAFAVVVPGAWSSTRRWVRKRRRQRYRGRHARPRRPGIDIRISVSFGVAGPRGIKAARDDMAVAGQVRPVGGNARLRPPLAVSELPRHHPPPEEDVHDMATEREIRRRVISQLVSVYTSTPDEAEPQDPTEGLDLTGWTTADLAAAYAEAMGMFIYYAKEVESEHGPGFLDHLQRQAVANEQDDDPSADLPPADL